MEEKIYSIIDIETTGGQKDGHKITEISIFNFNGKEILAEFTTLINPERLIPASISHLTGITNQMVQESPKFFEVAKKIVEMTEGNIFVAHNVFFDYNFIKKEFSELGYSFKRDKLCTVRLARKAFPGHKSYSLGKICKDLGIPLQDRHRAQGDARATVELFRKILEKQELTEKDFSQSKKTSLPPKLPQENFDLLPHKPGVYYFYNEFDELLYVGKSKDIKKRVQGHFQIDVTKRKDRELKGNIAKIEYKLTGNELAALLLEAQEIKSLFPPFNVSLKRRRFPLFLELKRNKQGILEFKTTRRKSESLFKFRNKNSAKRRINAIYQTLLGQEKDSLQFEQSRDKLIQTVGIETYNEQLKKCFHRKVPEEANFSLKLRGPEKHCLIKVKNYYPQSLHFLNSEGEETFKRRLLKDPDMQGLLYDFLYKNNVPLLKDETSREFN